MRDNVWFTSDLHLGHANIIKFCNRPFESVEEMNSSIIASINRHVPEEGVLFILGDAVMGKVSETLPLLAGIKATVKLVPGNHDRCWIGNGASSGKWVERYKQEGGISEILDGLVTETFQGQQFTLCHFPATGDSREETRFVDHRPSRPGWILHGHTHGAWRQDGEMIDVGLDSWGGRPVSVEEIMEIVQSGPSRLEKLPWS